MLGVKIIDVGVSWGFCKIQMFEIEIGIGYINPQRDGWKL